MSTLALVPARARSARLPEKNRREVGGVPLWQRAVIAGCEAAGIDEVLVSTDDEEILTSDWAPDSDRPYSVVERPARLATATAPLTAVVAHHLRDSHEIVVLLLPTSPHRQPATVARAVEAAKRAARATAVTVVRRRDPHLAVDIGSDGRLATLPVSWPRSQDVPPAYRIHGAAIVTRPEAVRRGRLLRAPCWAVETDWREAVDVDTVEDLALAHAAVEEP